ncbi:hypothetical protein DACRYDRAFT_73794 [Dacryopinax primogenitus]|uniref:Uncharacterized protein n=1 Tax=Dacryopinax primogenitus (strain DJM 731) TaxID=1858805 RepID=M5GGZ9_DACPD|nr:uncharacterized protein DACRYDRAFT_73794 [Dacryopinax primogenitus]EJU06368.1 hypothetical protein DACRYDRAFT_73794 [Dacryopinax primogenitus]
MSYPNGFEDAPTYLSGHMADVVLSEFRPTRIKPDALRCVNVLLDELLWSIIKSARSVNTDKLKQDGVLRVIPAALGKESVLEAEMELREYWKTSGDSREAYKDMRENPAQFPIAQVFDVLRLKCEANSSLGQAEEEDNLAVEKAEQRLYQAREAPPIEAFAPASLYLTAIIEHICGHIMSCVSRVVARDSSKTSASISDLYAALCEDQSLYNMAKGMNSFQNIEAQHRSTRVQRKGSLTGSLVSARSRAAAASPRPGYEPPSSSPTNTSNRTSGDSSSHSGVMPMLQTQVQPGPSPIRSPSDRKKVPVIYPQIVSSTVSATNGRPSMSVEHGASPVAQQSYQAQQPHRRSHSGMSEHGQRGGGFPFQTDPNMTSVDDGEGSEFEELMRTGSTMKVSLTPDRLRTFEVFAKDRNQRATTRVVTTQPAGQPPESGPFTAPVQQPALPSSLSNSYGGRPGSRPSTGGRSGSPVNDGYMTDSAVGSRRPNSRQTSRTRLEAIPQLPGQRTVQALQLDEYGGRQPAQGPWGQPPSAPAPVSMPAPTPAPAPAPVPQPQVQPPRPRPVERVAIPPRQQPPFLDGPPRKQNYSPGNIAPLYEETDSLAELDERPKPKSIVSPTSPTSDGPPTRVSKSARDLIAFLDEGPPEEPPHLSRSTSAAAGLDNNNPGLKKSASRGFMNSLKGFGRSGAADKASRSGSVGGTEEYNSLRGLVRRQKSSHTLASTAMNSSTVNIPPPSPVRPVPVRIVLDSKDSIPGMSSRYRDNSVGNGQRPTPPVLHRDVPAQDVHAAALPTPPASHESPPMRTFAAYPPGGSPRPPVPPQQRKITPINTAPNSPLSGNDEYNTAPYNTYTRVAIDKVAEQPIVVHSPQNGTPNGAPISIPASSEEQLALLQKLVQASGSIEECRLLVDSFMAQRGVKTDGAASLAPPPTASMPGTPVSVSKPLPPDPEEENKEKAAVDWLLSGDTEYSAAGEKVTHKLARPKSRDRAMGDRKKSRERMRTTSQHKTLVAPA